MNIPQINNTTFSSNELNYTKKVKTATERSAICTFLMMDLVPFLSGDSSHLLKVSLSKKT